MITNFYIHSHKLKYIAVAAPIIGVTKLKNLDEVVGTYAFYRWRLIL